MAQTAQPAPPVLPRVSAELHENAIKFVELTGARQRIVDGSDKIVAAGEESIRKNFPGYDPQFAPEWGKRMRSRIKVDDYLAVFVQAYETHFDDKSIRELIEAQRSANQGIAPALSQQLKMKMAEEAITVQSEILGGCAQVGAKLGAEIGQEIQKEHPDWASKSKASGVE